MLEKYDIKTALKKCIEENPHLPIILVTNDDIETNKILKSIISIEELTFYNNKYYEKERFEDNIFDLLAQKEEYFSLSDEEFDNLVKEVVAKAEFTKAICITVE